MIMKQEVVFIERSDGWDCHLNVNIRQENFCLKSTLIHLTHYTK